MSDTSRVQLAALKEVTWGVTPASAMTNTRMTAESLKYNIGTDKSEEIRSDRQLADLIQTSFGASGDVNVEFSYGSYDPFIESAMYSTFSTAASISSSDISAANSDNSYNSASVNFTTSNLAVGQWIGVLGFTTTGNNGYAKIVSIAAGKLVVSDLTLTDEVIGDAITMKGSYIRNGTTESSYTLEAEFSDITQFKGYTGMVANTFSMDVSSQSKVTGAFGFVGKSGSLQATQFGTGGNTAASTTSIFSAGSHVQNVRENATAIAAPVYVKSLNFSLNNNITPADAVGQTGATSLSAGTVDVTGSLEVYFEDEILYNKFVNNTASSLDYRLKDAAGNAMIISFPNIKYDDGDIPTPGINQFGMVSLNFTCLLDATSGMIQIDNIPV